MGMILILLLLVIYAIPSLIAEEKNHNKRTSIKIVNIFLGWTFIGWVIALAWALNGDVEKEPKGSK